MSLGEQGVLDEPVPSESHNNAAALADEDASLGGTGVSGNFGAY